MNNKKLMIGACLILAVAFIVVGCGVSDYMTNEAEKDTNYSLLTENASADENTSAEINELPETAVNESKETVEEITAEPQETIEMTDETDIIIKVYENDTVELKPKTKDLDEDKLTFTFSDPVNKDGVWKTDFGDAGQYKIKVAVSDGTSEVSKNVIIMVQRKNVPPVIEAIAPITANEGDTIEIKPKIEDPNGDEFTVTIGDPVGDSGIWDIDYKSAGEYTVAITATDIDGAKSTEDVKIKVNKKNVPPVIMLEGVEDNKITINEGEKVELTLNITDPNGDEIKTTISDPIGDEGVWQTDYTDHGEYKIIISASDKETTTTKEITLVVNDINMPPEIIDIINAAGSSKPEVKAEVPAAVNETSSAECSEDSDCEGELMCVKGVCKE